MTIKNKLNGPINSLERPQDSIPHRDSRPAPIRIRVGCGPLEYHVAT